MSPATMMQHLGPSTIQGHISIWESTGEVLFDELLPFKRSTPSCTTPLLGSGVERFVYMLPNTACRLPELQACISP